VTYEALKSARDLLINNSDITNIVPSTNIQVGWQHEIKNFPSIILYQTGGSEFGYLGYNTAPSGQKIRRELMNLKVDIISNTSRYQTLQVSDLVTKTMISGLGARKISDYDDFSDSIKAYLKSLTFMYTVFHED